MYTDPVILCLYKRHDMELKVSHVQTLLNIYVINHGSHTNLVIQKDTKINLNKKKKKRRYKTACISSKDCISYIENSRMQNFSLLTSIGL